MNEAELSAYARAIRPFRRTEVVMGSDFGERHFVVVLRRNSTEWFDVIQLVRADLSRAWEGRPSACCEDTNCCFDLQSRSEYAALFAMEYAALGASTKETVKMTLDLHDALDREHHVAEEPADLAVLHFAAVHPDRELMAA
ncbi:hypothetical protein ACFY9N_05865 [Microbacterium sp. NPDC008134]|uniref:hypothetical protein n=1 Tax=Microbacterium sp. NPDC008134 TaxID=3364183 RepID=UPI0036E10E0E